MARLSEVHKCIELPSDLLYEKYSKKLFDIFTETPENLLIIEQFVRKCN